MRESIFTLITPNSISELNYEDLAAQVGGIRPLSSPEIYVPPERGGAVGSDDLVTELQLYYKKLRETPSLYEQSLPIIPPIFVP